jgi:hypothetical protein
MERMRAEVSVMAIALPHLLLSAVRRAFRAYPLVAPTGEPVRPQRGPYTGRGARAHGAMNKECHVCARRRVGEAAGPDGLVGDRTRAHPPALFPFIHPSPTGRSGDAYRTGWTGCPLLHTSTLIQYPHFPPATTNRRAGRYHVVLSERHHPLQYCEQRVPERRGPTRRPKKESGY